MIHFISPNRTLGEEVSVVGMCFVGQMKQNFMVLTDKGVKRGDKQSRGGGGTRLPTLSGGNKRTLELEEWKDNGGFANRQAMGKEVERGGSGGKNTPGKK